MSVSSSGETRRRDEARLSIQDLTLIAVLLAAGAVLKLTLGSVLTFAGMKPNFIIAMYCLAILIAKPRPAQALVIGVIAGLICQIPMMNATPWLNVPSEALGALAMGLLALVPMKVGRVDLGAVVAPFVATVVSGYTFVLLLATLNGIAPQVAIVTYAVMVFGTATFNAFLVQLLVVPLRRVLKRQEVRGGVAREGHLHEADRAGVAAKSGVAAGSKEPVSLDRACASHDGPMLELRDFCFRYAEGERAAVCDVNLSVPSGAFVGVTGAAGSGKSTLTYAMNGIIPHCYPGERFGSVLLGGVDTRDASLTDISRLVGSVCQDIDSQMVTSVVEDEMLYGLENFGFGRDEAYRRVEEALAAMGISDLRDRVIASLSGGQKQKVAIASILALRPRVLVLDEPTAELDPSSSKTVFDLLRSYAAEHGTTVVVVEQKIALLSDYADMLVIMENGRVRFCGAPSEILEHADELLAIGVACPRSTSLTNRLKREGLYDGPQARNVETACDVLAGVLR